MIEMIDWLKPTYRKPPIGINVLGAFPTSNRVLVQHICHLNDSGFWVVQGCSTCLEPEYWMPLPEAPKQNK